MHKIVAQPPDLWPDSEQRACKSAEPDLFFPEIGDKRSEKQALKICSDCPCRDECLMWALKNDEKGIWGGQTERQRTRYLRVYGALVF